MSLVYLFIAPFSAIFTKIPLKGKLLKKLLSFLSLLFLYGSPIVSIELKFGTPCRTRVEKDNLFPSMMNRFIRPSLAVFTKTIIDV